MTLLGLSANALMAMSCVTILAGCGAGEQTSPTPELQAGWVTNCVGRDFKILKVAPPVFERALFSLTDQLVLAIPKNNYPRSPPILTKPSSCRSISNLPPMNWVEFLIQGDWSNGYKVEDIPNEPGGLKRFKPDRVWVRIEAKHWTDGGHPRSPEEQKAVDEILRKFWQNDTLFPKFNDGALTCYRGAFCLVSGTEYNRDTPRFSYNRVGHFVLLQGHYSLSLYGGISVYWQAWASKLSTGVDIHEAVLKTLADWNVAVAETSDKGPEPSHGRRTS